VPDDIVVIRVGSDRFRAQLIAEACRAEGITVELLTGDDSGVDPFMAMIQQHRLLVAAGDADRVRAIVDRGSPSERRH
jgi:Tfp pilus assembly protein PilN